MDLGKVNTNLNIQKVSDANLAVPVLPFVNTKYKIYNGLNSPVPGTHTFIIEAIGDSATIFSQRAICVYTSTDVRILGNMYLRHCNNGTWTAWESCVTNTDLTTMQVKSKRIYLASGESEKITTGTLLVFARLNSPDTSAFSGYLATHTSPDVFRISPIHESAQCKMAFTYDNGSITVKNAASAYQLGMAFYL